MEPLTCSLVNHSTDSRNIRIIFIIITMDKYIKWVNLIITMIAYIVLKEYACLYWLHEHKYQHYQLKLLLSEQHSLVKQFDICISYNHLFRCKEDYFLDREVVVGLQEPQDFPVYFNFTCYLRNLSKYNQHNIGYHWYLD